MSSNEINPIRIPVREGVYLSKLSQTDKPALVQHLSTPEINQNTLTIPYPYQETDADSWLSQRIEHARRIGVEVTFAIRNQDDEPLNKRRTKGPPLCSLVHVTTLTELL